MYVPSSSDPIINLAPGVKAPHSASSSSPVALERFRRPTKVLPCCSVMTSVARPPRRPSTLAIRSRWPAHLPTRDTESAPSAGVATRMAKVAAHKRAFKLSLHVSMSRGAPRTNCFVLWSPHQAQKCQVFGVSQCSSEVARPKRFELLTPRFVVWCRVQTVRGMVSHVAAGTRCDVMHDTRPRFGNLGHRREQLRRGPPIPLIPRSILFYDWFDRTLPTVAGGMHHARSRGEWT